MEYTNGTAGDVKLNYGVELKCNTLTIPKNTENIMDKFFNSDVKKIKKSDIPKKDNILITGVGGFVGANIAQVLKSRGKNVIGILRDNVPSDWLSNALTGVTIIQGDIRNKDLIRRTVEQYNINQIYHIAAVASVKTAHKDPFNVFDTNVMGTISVLEAARNSGRFSFNDPDFGNIIILETDKCYGEKLNAIETDPYVSSEPYATSKSCQGLVAQSYRSTYDMSIKIAHSANIFGYDFRNRRLISNTIKTLIKGERPLIYTNDKSMREYVFVNDACDALYLLMSDTYDKQTYNIRTGWYFNQKDIVELIVQYWNEINFEDVKPMYEEGKIPRQIQEESMQSINWDWQPSWSWEDALRETLDLFMIYKSDYI